MRQHIIEWMVREAMKIERCSFHEDNNNWIYVGGSVEIICFTVNKKKKVMFVVSKDY